MVTEISLDNDVMELLADAGDFAVGVSGGPDSMALCHALSFWAKEKDITIYAVTVDHGLRAEAAEEARQVREWVKAWPRVAHVVLSAEDRLKDDDTRLMEQARIVRYELIDEFCREKDIKNLALAHHLDDQSETVLFRLAKGSGLDGLSGMSAIQSYGDSLVLLRPLLETPKEDLVQYCEVHNISFVRDPTNQKEEYARPRLRKARKVLEEEGLTAKRMGVLAKRLGRAQEALVSYANTAYQEALAEASETQILLKGDVLADKPAETRLRVIAMAMDALDRAKEQDSGYGPRLNKLETLVEDLFFDKKAFKRRTLGGFYVSYDLKNDTICLQHED